MQAGLQVCLAHLWRVMRKHVLVLRVGAGLPSVGMLGAGMDDTKRRDEAESYTYRVRASEHGFIASCSEMDLDGEGDTVAVAVQVLRAAIAEKHRAP